jgi:hypothetical protein
MLSVQLRARDSISLTLLAIYKFNPVRFLTGIWLNRGRDIQADDSTGLTIIRFMTSMPSVIGPV